MNLCIRFPFENHSACWPRVSSNRTARHYMLSFSYAVKSFMKVRCSAVSAWPNFLRKWSVIFMKYVLATYLQVCCCLILITQSLLMFKKKKKTQPNILKYQVMAWKAIGVCLNSMRWQAMLAYPQVGSKHLWVCSILVLVVVVLLRTVCSAVVLTSVWHAYFLFFLFSFIFNWWNSGGGGGRGAGWLWFVWLCSLVSSVPAANNTADWFFQVSNHSADRPEFECEQHSEAGPRWRPVLPPQVLGFSPAGVSCVLWLTSRFIWSSNR